MSKRYGQKLTAEQVVEIREAVAAGDVSRLEIAAQFGIRRGQLDKIVRGTAWANAGGRITRIDGPRSNTGYWGVTANTMGNRFQVCIRVNGRVQWLGYLKDPVAAALPYDARARKLGYPPEKLNFPDDEHHEC